MMKAFIEQGKRDSYHKDHIYRGNPHYVPNHMPNTQKYALFNAYLVRKAEAIPPADQVQYTGKSTGCSFAELLAEHIHNRCGIWPKGTADRFRKTILFIIIIKTIHFTRRRNLHIVITGTSYLFCEVSCKYRVFQFIHVNVNRIMYKD